jgi:hypothetical protein
MENFSNSFEFKFAFKTSVLVLIFGAIILLGSPEIRVWNKFYSKKKILKNFKEFSREWRAEWTLVTVINPI